jgi:hypothetical protein
MYPLVNAAVRAMAGYTLTVDDLHRHWPRVLRAEGYTKFGAIALLTELVLLFTPQRVRDPSTGRVVLMQRFEGEGVTRTADEWGTLVGIDPWSLCDEVNALTAAGLITVDATRSPLCVTGVVRARLQALRVTEAPTTAAPSLRQRYPYAARLNTWFKEAFGRPICRATTPEALIRTADDAMRQLVEMLDRRREDVTNFLDRRYRLNVKRQAALLDEACPIGLLTTYISYALTDLTDDARTATPLPTLTPSAQARANGHSVYNPLYEQRPDLYAARERDLQREAALQTQREQERLRGLRVRRVYPTLSGAPAPLDLPDAGGASSPTR